jgi:hypothetical protein
MAGMIANSDRMFWKLIIVGGALGAFGCQPTPAPQSRVQPQVIVSGGQSSSDPPARTEQIEGAIHSDACAARLQEISGALLEYYALYERLPARLDVLNSLPDLDQPLAFSCPNSDRPFIYVPSGLRSAGDSRQIVLYDPAIDRAGLRWVIRMRRPSAREAAATWVEHVPASTFDIHPAAQPAAR